MTNTAMSWDLQTASYSNHKYCADIYAQSRIMDFDEHRKNKVWFRNNKLHWEQIPRANNPSKPLQEKAVNLLATVVHKLRKATTITLNHNYLTRITKCGKDQNVNLLKQLADVLDISFHAKTTINNKIYRNCYVIRNTQKGHSIIENPEVLLAQKHFVGSKAVNPTERLSTEDKKGTSCAEFFPPLSIYKEKVLENNRSIKSSFLQNSSFKKEKGKAPNSSPVISSQLQHKTPILQLKDFYPLSTEDASHLQSKSGREFSLNSMNEILLDMSKRVKDRWFKSKKGFLGYMTLAFKNEMRDAVKVSNNSFKIRANQTAKEVTIAQQEEFLSEIEYSLQVSPEWHLKKKLCSVLGREKAYNLLNSYKHCRQEESNFEIHLTKHVELTSLEMDVILNQVKAIYENLTIGKFALISSIKIIAQPPLVKAESSRAAEQDAAIQAGIWGSIRKALIDYYGEAVERSWFSKLEAIEDKQAKVVTLKAPNKFFKHWIEQNYLGVIERITSAHQYKLSFC